MRHYRETTLVAERTATENSNVMTKVQERMIMSIWARTFVKHISVAHSDNGGDIFHEVGLCFFHIFNVLCVYFFCGLS